MRKTADELAEEIRQLRDARWKAEQDREFAMKHGYDAAFKRKTEEIKSIEQKLRGLR